MGDPLLILAPPMDMRVFDEGWIEGSMGDPLLTLAPPIRPAPSNWISMNLPNRDELSLRIVLAFPKPSRIGLACVVKSVEPRH